MNETLWKKERKILNALDARLAIAARESLERMILRNAGMSSQLSEQSIDEAWVDCFGPIGVQEFKERIDLLRGAIREFVNPLVRLWLFLR